MPDYWHDETPDSEVDKQIGNPIPAIELVLIDAMAVLDRFIPVESDWAALKDGSEKAINEVKDHDSSHSC